MKFKLLLLLNVFVISCYGLDDATRRNIRYAIKNNRVQDVAKFLHQGISPDSIITSEDDSMLAYAIMNHVPEVARLLIKNGASLIKDVHGESPLALAVHWYFAGDKKENKEIVELLLDQKVNANPDLGKRPLLVALDNIKEQKISREESGLPITDADNVRNDEILKLLIKHGARVLPEEIALARASNLRPEVIKLLEGAQA